MRAPWATGAAVVALLVLAGLAVSWAVRRGADAPPSVSVTGTIEALQIDLSPKIAGRITTLAVREGARVTRGQVLARLDAEEIAAEARRMEAALRTAEANLRDLQAGARREEIEEAEAQAARAQSQLNDLMAGARAPEIEQARAALRNATATRVWTERDLKRIQELHGKDLVAMQEVDRARQAYEVAVANEQGAREKLALIESGPREHEVEAARAAVRATRERVQLLRSGPRAQAVAAAQAQVAEARAALALAEKRLAEMVLVSPVDGVVLHKNMEAGETAAPGASILTLMNPGDMWLRAYVSETDVGRVAVGQPAVVTVDAFPGRRFAGTVSEIGSEAEFTPKNVQTKKERVNLVFRVKIALRDPSGALKPGLPADAEIGTGTRP
jgi:HlyD family secretion protein